MKRGEAGEWLRSYALRQMPHGGARNRMLMISDMLIEEEDGVTVKRVSEFLEEREISLLKWQRKRLWGE